ARLRRLTLSRTLTRPLPLRAPVTVPLAVPQAIARTLGLAVPGSVPLAIPRAVPLAPTLTLTLGRRWHDYRCAITQPVGAVGHDLLTNLQSGQHRHEAAVGRPDLHRA